MEAGKNKGVKKAQLSHGSVNHLLCEGMAGEMRWLCSFCYSAKIYIEKYPGFSHFYV